MKHIEGDERGENHGSVENVEQCLVFDYRSVPARKKFGAPGVVSAEALSALAK